MKYVARSAHITRRAPSHVVETGVEASRQWTSMVKESPASSTRAHEVEKTISSRGLTGYQVRGRMIAAATLPCWDTHSDPYDRLFYCLIDNSVYQAAHDLVKKGRPPLSHQQALSYSHAMDDILSMVSPVTDITNHIPALSILLLTPIDTIRSSRMELPFTPSLEELSSRVTVDTTTHTFSLYPRVSKDNIATRQSIAAQHRRSFTWFLRGICPW